MTGWELDRGGRGRGGSPVGKRRGENAGGGPPDTIGRGAYVDLYSIYVRKRWMDDREREREN